MRLRGCGLRCGRLPACLAPPAGGGGWPGQWPGEIPATPQKVSQLFPRTWAPTCQRIPIRRSGAVDACPRLRRLLSRQCLQQRLGVLEVGRVKALGEPAVDRR